MIIEELILQKKNIIEQAIIFLKKNHSNKFENYNKCYKDISLVLDSFIHDIVNDSVSSTIYIASKFWVRSKRQILNYKLEFAVYNFIVDYIINKQTLNSSLSQKIQNLKKILFQIIEFGPIKDPNSWDYIISNRFNTYNWQSETPPRELIDEILQEVHDYVPSKQRVVRYNINVLKNDNDDLKKIIYKTTKAKPGNIPSRYNPQVLAPWLLIFSVRNGLNVSEKEAYMDMGLAINFISLSASQKQIDAGFCACIRDKETIQQHLGIYPSFYLGLGYRNDAKTYYCIENNRIAHVPNNDLNQKPNKESYIFYV